MMELGKLDEKWDSQQLDSRRTTKKSNEAGLQSFINVIRTDLFDQSHAKLYDEYLGYVRTKLPRSSH